MSAECPECGAEVDERTTIRTEDMMTVAGVRGLPVALVYDCDECTTRFEVEL